MFEQMTVPALQAVENVCGQAARKIVQQRMTLATHEQKKAFVTEMGRTSSDIRKAYVTMDTLARQSHVRTLWPHMNITERDVRNAFRVLCPDFKHASVSGWGFLNTYNPKVSHGATLPMLVHAFGAKKQVAENDQGWKPFMTDYDAEPGHKLARPVLRSLSDPQTISTLVLSCSLLSNTKCSTAAPLGWILNAPVWNIYGFAPRDIQFSNDTALGMTGIEQAQGIAVGRNNVTLKSAYDDYPDLARVLTQTTGQGGESNYNEIVVLGNSRLFMTSTEVSGIFVKVCTHDKKRYLVDAISSELAPFMPQMSFYVDDEVIKAIKRCATLNRLPIVAVEDAAMDELRTGYVFDEVFEGLIADTTWNCVLG